MKLFRAGFFSLSLLALACTFVSFAEPAYHGSSFYETWQVVKNFGTYNPDALPVARPGFRQFFGWFKETIREAGKRTISTKADLTPNFQKLVHSNGVCLAGTWNITEENAYTGYFAKGSRAQIIVRASEATGYPSLPAYRAMGFAGKLFPTTDANTHEKFATANFFTVDDLGGTKAAHYTDVALTNKPALTANRSWQFIKGLQAAAEIAGAFRLADSHVGERQLYEISELGLQNPSEAHTPNLMRISASAGTVGVDEADFRRELLLSRHGGELKFDIAVKSYADAGWQTIGNIDLTDDALTVACDHELHFHHPKWRKDLH